MIKEKTIDRVLHWQHVDGTWIPYSAEQLTRKVEKQNECLKSITKTLNGTMPDMMREQAL